VFVSLGVVVFGPHGLIVGIRRRKAWLVMATVSIVAVSSAYVTKPRYSMMQCDVVCCRLSSCLCHKHAICVTMVPKAPNGASRMEESINTHSSRLFLAGDRKKPSFSVFETKHVLGGFLAMMVNMKRGFWRICKLGVYLYCTNRQLSYNQNATLNYGLTFTCGVRVKIDYIKPRIRLHLTAALTMSIFWVRSSAY
jgi:hypothetical protein